MNQHDDGLGQDHGWVDPAESGLLKRTFSAMAGGVDPASPTGPAATMTAMSRRVRRRRTAKLGGLGGGALALTGALVLGAGQLVPSDQSEQLLPGASSSAPDFELQDGYQPPWLDWSDLTCGMPVTDLKSTAPGWSVAPAGDLYGRTADLGDERSKSWGIASTLKEGQGTLDVAPVLVWSKDGVVQDLGPNVFEAPGPQSEPLVGAGEDAVAATGGSVSTCAPTSTDIDPVYETPLPEGDYEVRVVAFPELASGKRATAVSEPVLVRVNGDATHSSLRLGAARGESTMESPEPVEGQVARFELDRTAEWVRAEMTQSGYPSDTDLRVNGQCEGGDREALLPIELVVSSTGEVVGSTQISCDGYESGSEVGPLAAADGEAIDVRLPSVPDGVTRLWVSLEPATPPDNDASDDCSATDFDTDFNLDNFLTGDSAVAASDIVMAAEECDSDALIALAKESETELMSSAETPEQVFALPESGTEHYRTLVALLANTRGEVIGELVGDATGDETMVWPRAATEEYADSDEAWDEVVAAGLLTEAEAEAQRADGYQGMRVGITLDGTWLYYSAGD